MSVKHSYKCDLCWEPKEKEDLLCLFWNSTLKTDIGFGAYEFSTNIGLSDKHLCKSCIELIKKHIVTDELWQQK